MDIPANNALHRSDHMCCNQNGINGLIRMRSMATLSIDHNLEFVSSSHHRSRIDANHARFKSWPIMQGINRLTWEPVKQPIIDHCFCSTEPFLSRLKNEGHSSVEMSCLSQIFRS